MGKEQSSEIHVGLSGLVDMQTSRWYEGDVIYEVMRPYFKALQAYAESSNMSVWLRESGVRHMSAQAEGSMDCRPAASQILTEALASERTMTVSEQQIASRLLLNTRDVDVVVEDDPWNVLGYIDQAIETGDLDEVYGGGPRSVAEVTESLGDGKWTKRKVLGINQLISGDQVDLIERIHSVPKNQLATAVILLTSNYPDSGHPYGQISYVLIDKREVKKFSETGNGVVAKLFSLDIHQRKNMNGEDPYSVFSWNQVLASLLRSIVTDPDCSMPSGDRLDAEGHVRSLNNAIPARLLTLSGRFGRRKMLDEVWFGLTGENLEMLSQPLAFRSLGRIKDWRKRLFAMNRALPMLVEDGPLHNKSGGITGEMKSPLLDSETLDVVKEQVKAFCATDHFGTSWIAEQMAGLRQDRWGELFAGIPMNDIYGLARNPVRFFYYLFLTDQYLLYPKLRVLTGERQQSFLEEMNTLGENHHYFLDEAFGNLVDGNQPFELIYDELIKSLLYGQYHSLDVEASVALSQVGFKRTATIVARHLGESEPSHPVDFLWSCFNLLSR